MWLRSSCRARRSSPAFETLSHSASRTFYHKSRLVPPSALEKFRASTTAADPSEPRAFFVLHVAGLASITRNGFRPYSKSSALQAMADQTWTGPKVRETFLNYFAERGHSIGMPPSPHAHSLCLQCAEPIARATLSFICTKSLITIMMRNFSFNFASELG
ncbi:hypothetical protein B0T14DRAFT_418794 [Immersiella caudata]|uniref:Uncharacterized protein n=1 Tax=Immersiella caudata TaxID=314043 RepID=A0AA40CD46_9PEZI|nr:hypothetical protein B0T14DRAFT_418794 [Immersiella caudata]